VELSFANYFDKNNLHRVDFSLMPISENWKKISEARLHKSRKSKVEKQPENVKASTEKPLWFDVKKEDLARSELEKTKQHLTALDLFPSALEGITPKSHKDDPLKYIAMDCEMVGFGSDGKEHALARVSLVNYHGAVLLDTFVKPNVKVTDFRTEVSGVRPRDIHDAPDLSEIQQKVIQLLDGRVLVGHSLKNDFRVLMLSHPRGSIRDTSKFRPFRKLSRGKNPSLRMLSQHVLGLTIQTGAHDSIDDARVAMLLYRRVKDDWENYLFRQEGKQIKEIKRKKSKRKK
jgi:RNA exonuclease 4